MRRFLMMIGVSEVIAILGVILYLIIPLLFLKMVYKLRKIDSIQREQSKKIDSIQSELNRLSR
jgi:predicted Holliday junction resolvase-like endonuclease